MRRLRFHWVDVFTDRAFGGNQLAVFTDGRGLPSETMQAIARELNISETTFVLPPDDPQNDFKVRIFTPATELPMAGHPTVGTAFVLRREGLAKADLLKLEEGVGVIPVALGADGLIQMTQPLPKFGPTFNEAGAIAEMLSLDPGSITDTGLPLEVVSCGLPFLFVPLRDLRAIRAIRFRTEVWERVLRGLEAPPVFVFTREVETAGSTVHSRMFAPSMGILEDPATGSASGPLGCYLVRHAVLGRAARVAMVSEQGFEIGRPSFIQIAIEMEGERFTGVRVGGHCHFVADGHLEV